MARTYEDLVEEYQRKVAAENTAPPKEVQNPSEKDPGLPGGKAKDGLDFSQFRKNTETLVQDMQNVFKDRDPAEAARIRAAHMRPPREGEEPPKTTVNKETVAQEPRHKKSFEELVAEYEKKEAVAKETLARETTAPKTPETPQHSNESPSRAADTQAPSVASQGGLDFSQFRKNVDTLVQDMQNVFKDRDPAEAARIRAAHMRPPREGEEPPKTTVNKETVAQEPRHKKSFEELVAEYEKKEAVAKENNASPQNRRTFEDLVAEYEKKEAVAKENNVSPQNRRTFEDLAHSYGHTEYVDSRGRTADVLRDPESILRAAQQPARSVASEPVLRKSAEAKREPVATNSERQERKTADTGKNTPASTPMRSEISEQRPPVPREKADFHGGMTALFEERNMLRQEQSIAHRTPEPQKTPFGDLAGVGAAFAGSSIGASMGKGDGRRFFEGITGPGSAFAENAGTVLSGGPAVASPSSVAEFDRREQPANQVNEKRWDIGASR
jgi:hypothetical protein